MKRVEGTKMNEVEQKIDRVVVASDTQEDLLRGLELPAFNVTQARPSRSCSSFTIR